MRTHLRRFVYVKYVSTREYYRSFLAHVTFSFNFTDITSARKNLRHIEYVPNRSTTDLSLSLSLREVSRRYDTRRYSRLINNTTSRECRYIGILSSSR